LFLVLKAIDGTSTVAVLHSKLIISEVYEHRFLVVTLYVKIFVELERLHSLCPLKYGPGRLRNNMYEMKRMKGFKWSCSHV